MKKRLSVIMLSLVLVLTGLMPATALASETKKGNDIVAAGYLSSISPTIVGTNVFPTGSGGWRVVGREVGGNFTSGIIRGPFTLTYDAIVNAYQGGSLHGTLEASGYQIDVKGKSENAMLLGLYPDPVTGPAALAEIKISGKWTVKDGAKGHGDFTANMVVVTDGVHIFAVLPQFSAVTLTGSLDNDSDNDSDNDNKDNS
ncbi:MAG: hypothetical protein Q7J73_05925 [Dehalococcoidales bacterium]|nr:hypothetical protein [Dehalococcoidales bacterium]